MDVMILRSLVLCAVLFLPSCSPDGSEQQRSDVPPVSAAPATDSADEPARTAADEKPAGDAATEPAAPEGDKPTEEQPAQPDEPTGKPEPPKRPTHEHKAFKERAAEREGMVRRQIEARGVKDKTVLAALRTVPRHAFVTPEHLGRAYIDSPLPIGLGQTISQPYIVGYMTEQLGIDADDKVLEIGTGSGYQAAVCAEIAAEVYSIEILKTLGAAAGKRLKELGYRNATTKVADGYHGWPEHGPFDAIIVTAAAQHVPPPLVKQLKPGGRMMIPVGGPFAAQYLILVTKDADGKVASKSLLPVRFVPLTRAKQE